MDNVNHQEWISATPTGTGRCWHVVQCRQAQIYSIACWVVL